MRANKKTQFLFFTNFIFLLVNKVLVDFMVWVESFVLRSALGSSENTFAILASPKDNLQMHCIQVVSQISCIAVNYLQKKEFSKKN